MQARVGGTFAKRPRKQPLTVVSFLPLIGNAERKNVMLKPGEWFSSFSEQFSLMTFHPEIDIAAPKIAGGSPDSASIAWLV